MKAAAILTLATGALAGVVVRDATAVKQVIDTAGSDIAALTKAVNAYNGDKGPLVEAADKLVSDLKAGKETVSAGGNLDITDAAVLGGPVTELAKSGGVLTDALKAKKSEVEKAGECKTVQDQISAIYTSSNDLIDTVVAKVDEAAQGIAKELAGKLTTVLEDAKSSYQDCTNSGNGGGDTEEPTGGMTSDAPKPTDSAMPTESAKPTGGKPTGGVTTDCPPTGTGGQPQPTGEQPPMVTGAAAAFAPAGILAAVAAVFAL